MYKNFKIVTMPENNDAPELTELYPGYFRAAIEENSRLREYYASENYQRQAEDLRKRIAAN